MATPAPTPPATTTATVVHSHQRLYNGVRPAGASVVGVVVAVAVAGASLGSGALDGGGALACGRSGAGGGSTGVAGAGGAVVVVDGVALASSCLQRSICTSVATVRCDDGPVAT